MKVYVNPTMQKKIVDVISKNIKGNIVDVRLCRGNLQSMRAQQMIVGVIEDGLHKSIVIEPREQYEDDNSLKVTAPLINSELLEKVVADIDAAFSRSGYRARKAGDTSGAETFGN